MAKAIAHNCLIIINADATTTPLTGEHHCHLQRLLFRSMLTKSFIATPEQNASQANSQSKFILLDRGTVCFGVGYFHARSQFGRAERFV